MCKQLGSVTCPCCELGTMHLSLQRSIVARVTARKGDTVQAEVTLEEDYDVELFCDECTARFTEPVDYEVYDDK